MLNEILKLKAFTKFNCFNAGALSTRLFKEIYKYHTDIPVCYRKGNKKIKLNKKCVVSLETTRFDSTFSAIKKYHKTFLQINDCLYSVYNGILLLEEFENGLPHSKYKEALRVLISGFNLSDSQLFVTTYSSKVLLSFIEVVKEYNQESQFNYFDISDKINVYSAETAKGFISKDLDLITEQTSPFNFSLS